MLSSMQQKLDDLCEQLSSIKNHTGSQPNTSSVKNVESLANNAFGCDQIRFIDCGCWHCDHHQEIFAGLMVRFIRLLLFVCLLLSFAVLTAGCYL